MAQYLMSVWHDGDYAAADLDESDAQRMFAQVGAFNEELERAGAWVFAGGLQPNTTATVLPRRRRPGLDDRRPLRRSPRSRWAASG